MANANGADPGVARLDNWFWTPAPPGRDVLSGEIFDDPPPRSWLDGAGFEASNVSEPWSSEGLRRARSS